MYFLSPAVVFTNVMRISRYPKSMSASWMLASSIGRTPVCYNNRINSTADGRRAEMLEYALNVLGRDGHDGVVRIAALLEHLDLLLERNQWKPNKTASKVPEYKMDYPMGTP
jgi:hypothetical protein